MIRVTPDTYKAMNHEFIEESTPFRLTIPTQQEIDDCIERSKYCHPKVVHKHMTYDDNQESEIELHFGSQYESEIEYDE